MEEEIVWIVLYVWLLCQVIILLRVPLVLKAATIILFKSIHVITSKVNSMEHLYYTYLWTSLKIELNSCTAHLEPDIYLVASNRIKNKYNN